MNTFEQRKKDWDFKWMKIANVLSKGFLDVHHKTKPPIDVIEEVQELYFNDIFQSLSDYKKELGEEFEKIGKEIFESNKIDCPSCGEPVKDTDILVKDTWIYRDLLSLLQKDKNK